MIWTAKYVPLCNSGEGQKASCREPEAGQPHPSGHLFFTISRTVQKPCGRASAPRIFRSREWVSERTKHFIKTAVQILSCGLTAVKLLFPGQGHIAERVKITIDRSMLGGAGRPVPSWQATGLEAPFSGMASGGR